MADSAVEVTAGSGTNIDTRTEGTNGNHRQVIVIGDPATNAGVAPVDATKGLAVDLTATGQNSTALKVDGSAVTQPVSASSLPLPSGAATAANQSTANTALSAIETAVEAIQLGQLADGHNVTVDNGAGASAVNIQDGGNTITVDGTVTANLSAVDNAVLDDIAAKLGTIDTDTGNIDTSLNNIEASVATEGSALGSGVLLQGDDGTDRKNVNVDATTGDVQVDVTNTVTVDGSGVTQPISHAALTELAAAIDTEVQVDVVGALPAGTNNIGDVDVASIAAGDNNIGNVDIASIAAGDNNIGNVDVASISAGSNLIGDVGISGARTSGGTTPYKNLDVDESEDEVKASAGQVYWIHAINTTASIIYLKFYNATTANVTVGTTVPVHTFPVPANADSDGAGFTLSIPNGIAFSTAITIAATTGVADNDTGAPGANALIVNLGYA